MHLLECILNFRNASMPVLPPEHDNPGAGWCSRDSDKAKGWTFRGSNPGRGKRFFFPQKHQGQLWAPPSLQLNGDRVSFPGVKLPGREVDHSPPRSAEFKNEWSNTSAPFIRLHGVDIYTHARTHIRLFSPVCVKTLKQCFLNRVPRNLRVPQKTVWGSERNSVMNT